MGNKSGRPPTPLAVRFWSKVDKGEADECWLWRGTTIAHGYGVILRHGEHGPSVRAHRVAWELTNGEIPDGLLVCHSCDVRRCCNPSHLFLGTHADNTKDMMNKGRGPTGERQGRAKLDREKVAEIRSLVSSGTPQRRVARQFGVSAQTVCNIISGHSWKEVSCGST